METLELHQFHQSLNAQFEQINDVEVVQSYGDPLRELTALNETAGVLDLSFRGRICLTGNDRVRFLNGQVTNNVKTLQPNRGCYAALSNAKGRMESDLNIHCLKDELVLDFEPGLQTPLIARLEKFIVADDVEVMDLKPLYGLLSIQGPNAAEVMQKLELFPTLPEGQYTSITAEDSTLGELVALNLSRFGSGGFDLLVPNEALGAVLDRLIAAAKAIGGNACGWTAMELARIEAGIPRYGMDMDETTIPLEAGIEERAVSYSKGCYIGQEVINRIHSIGEVAKSLQGLLLENELTELPRHGDRLFDDGKDVGYVTSVLKSPSFKRHIALAYVRKGSNQIGNQLTLKTSQGESSVKVTTLPFDPAAL